MKNLRMLTGIGFVLLLLMVMGCDDNNDPTLANVKLEMKAISELSGLNVSGRMMNTSVDFQEVLLGVTEIEFESYDSYDKEYDDIGDDSSDDRKARRMDDDDDDYNDDGGDDQSEIEFEGRFTVDLINGTSTPDFGIANVIPGFYEEIEIETGPVLEDGNSIYVLMDYQPEGEDPITIEFSSTRSIEIEIENDQGIQLNEGDLARILVLLDLDQLFAGVDFRTANASEDGVVRINDRSNREIADLIWSNAKNAFDAGEDEDGDDDIDDDSEDD
jgi:hypothetical protein